MTITAKPAIVPTVTGAPLLSVPSTLFIGEPGKPLDVLLELRLEKGRWAADPIVSGGNFTNRTDTSIFVTVQDHANVTGLQIDVSGVQAPGEPINVTAIVSRRGAVLYAQRFLVGYIAGAQGLFDVPFFNPSTNDRQETFLFVGAANDPVTLRIFGTDNDGILRGPAVFEIAAHCARTITAKQIEDSGLGAPAGKYRLAIGADAPVSIVGKVRNGFDQTITENPVYLVEGEG